MSAQNFGRNAHPTSLRSLVPAASLKLRLLAQTLREGIHEAHAATLPPLSERCARQAVWDDRSRQVEDRMRRRFRVR